ncbi:hypothetical protein MLD38_014111 [Melastoma candidum]|uniref:Uncharacterized protein n=1 Tax=Melastoma candidum TaxID=119954 RepID=A0ACB9RB35_9MYRT|nr:hypothetical protein MLD38_014111 [Melastoma candidum]
MAACFVSSSIRICVSILLVVCLLVSGEAVAENRHYATVPLSSLVGGASSSSAARAAAVAGHGGRDSVIRVVHNPNFRLLDQSEILRRDEARVASLQSRMIPGHQNGVTKRELSASSGARIPTTSGLNVGNGNYLVTVELGSQRKKLQLTMDTGSPLTWTQCQPCATSCYNQPDPIFDPSASSTYSNISCSSSSCSRLFAVPQSCPSDNACRYSISYGDNSTSGGQVATDTLALTSTVKLPNYIFGCGRDNKGLFNGTDGLLGLSNDGIFSMVTQSASRFGKYFSYCLPPSTNSAGFLAFGNTTERSLNSTSLGFTPLVTVPENPSFYGIRIIGISVGGVPLPVSSSRILMNSSSIIDSGTVITRLPAKVYSALRSAFRKSMTRYPKAPGNVLLDTCYDFSKFSTITYPRIVINFSGGVNVDLDISGIFFGDSTQMCLAFSPGTINGLLIYGNVQQRTFEIGYDVAGRKLEFRANGCS